MSTAPASNSKRTAIYHITPMDNLPSILAAGLLSDARHRRGEFSCMNIGHMHIKDRRMNRRVPVAAGGVLGDYVPFNFCSRSVMLCSIFYRNVVGYSGDQARIVHLVSTVGEAIECGQPWAFTDRHAELGYARYFDDLKDLGQVNWPVMQLRDWGGDQETRETRQAEFLVHGRFPWACVRWIGVHNPAAAQAVASLLSRAAHHPKISVKPHWYYP